MDENLAKASAKLKSWIKTLESLETDILYSNTIRINNTAKLNVYVKHLKDLEYQLIGNLSNNKINVDLYMPLSKLFHFHGDLIKVNESLYNIKGELTNQILEKFYDVNSIIVTQDGAPFSVDVTAEPKTANTDRIVLMFKRNRYGLKLDVDGGSFNSTVDANILNSLNWDVRARINNIYMLNTYMNVQVNGNTTLYVHTETPWNDLRILTVNGNLMLTNTSGDIRLNHRLNDERHYAALQWTLIYMVDMFAKLVTEFENAELGRKDFSTHVFFKNPGKLFRNLDMGFDLNLDRKAWEFETNATLGFRNQHNVDAVFVVKLPPPDNDDHRFLISYHTNKEVQDISYVLGYNAIRAKTNYASDGSVCISLYYDR